MASTTKPMYHFPSRRSVVHSLKGIVSSSQPIASQVGVRILEQGGNAADAAVAVAAVLNLTEPNSCGIGGDMFCMFYDASNGKIRALNGSGRSAANSSLESIRADLGIQEGRIPTTSVHSVTVPGAAAGWVDTVEKFGSGNLSLAEVLAPAIRLGEEGYPISEIAAYSWNKSEKRIKEASMFGHELLKPDTHAEGGYRAPKVGEIMTNRTLAHTFKQVAKHGKAGFYQGSVAHAIVKETTRQGGHLTLEDLRSHGDAGSEETEPISIRLTALGVNADRGGLNVYEHMPNGQGIVALMSLGIIQELEKTGQIKKWSISEHNSVDHLHPVIESLRLGFADAHWYVTDPNVISVPTAELLSPAYLSTRAALYKSTTALPQDLTHGSPALSSSDTVYFSVADEAGNACSFIFSNYLGFGSAIVPPGCGFTLQNRGSNFNIPAPGSSHPNEYAPSKRPYHTIIPALATHADTGELAHVLGVMGGFMQPQGHVQVLLNMHVFGMDEQSALDAPRICIGEGMPDADGTVKGMIISVEEGIPEETIEGLKKLGHEVVLVTGHDRSTFGRGQVITKRVDGGRVVWSAGSDPRADGAAMPVV
ncbi:gamma-glutamyltranspeptidase [Microthyrium microscopicum]|uniref:Gamma-glutamyltranspeptidase n=1 Tax=Microthyrium microscopicum TaxID=703497 RepID=A0A6A6UPJ3_9PEZI|nr:gamma-glutamyltranspeptidase [Microthyrium microscopicum]